MLHAKFQDHRTYGSGLGEFYSCYHIWAWRPSLATDGRRRRTPEHGYTISSPCAPEGSV